MTKRKNVEGEREKELLHSLFMQAPVAIAIFRGSHYIIDLANPLICEIWERTQAQVLNKPLFEALPEAGGQGLEEILNTVLTTGKTHIGEELPVTLYRQGKKETVYFTFVYKRIYDQNEETSSVIVFATDVSEQMVARQKTEQLATLIEQQVQIFDTVLTAIQDFVYTFDISGRFIYSNKPLLDLLGITLDQIIGKNFHDLPYPPELATALQAQIAEVIKTQKPLTAETPYTNPAGHHGYYEYIFVPVFGKDKEIVAVAGSTRDITQRKILEQQKDVFMGIVSHELKTPVTSLKVFGQVLQRRLRREGNVEAVKHLEKMDAQINKLTVVINDLLDIARLDAEQLQFHENFFSFDELVDEIVEEIQRTTDTHNLVKEGHATKPVYGDRERIGQVIINLLTNAIKYSPHSDKIRVTTSTSSNKVTFCVQDFGIGIEEEKQSQVFERFFRVSGDNQKIYPGIGLGLYIAKEIIMKQGGHIWLESEPGKGSTFCFRLQIEKSDIQQQLNAGVAER